MVKDAFKMVVESNPYINKIHVLKDSLPAMLEELEAENFDYIMTCITTCEH
ncbi:MAG: hypothetical protein WDM71_06030 [Ferruginibacter sp.]